MGNAITIGIVNKNNSGNGLIVHLLGVKNEGLWIHDPMGNTYWEGKTYREVMYTNANSQSGEGGEKGKKILWGFDEIGKAPIMRINWIRLTRKINK
jgi:hypothetical protein